MSEDELASWGIDTSVPNIARVYELHAWAGKTNFATDRQVAEMALQRIAPDAPKTARANRLFLKRVVDYLATQAGIRQFLDIGSGLPSYGNVHEVAQEVDAEIRVVYVDNDPVVLAHGRAMLATNSHTTVVQADIRAPKTSSATPWCVSSSTSASRSACCSWRSCTTSTTTRTRPASPPASAARARQLHGHLHFLNPGQEHPDEAERAARAGPSPGRRHDVASALREQLFNENLGTGRWPPREEDPRFLRRSRLAPA